LYHNISNAHTAAIYSLAFDPSNPGFLASASSGITDKVKIWNINVNPPVSTKTLGGHSSASIVLSLAFESTGIMATGDNNNKLFIWNNNTDRTALVSDINTGDVVKALAFSPIMTDRLLVSGHFSAPYFIKTWNPTTGANIDTLISHSARILCFSFNTNGVLASGGADGNFGPIKLWDTSRTNFRNLTVTNNNNNINALAFSSNGTLIAGTSGSNPRVAVWY